MLPSNDTWIYSEYPFERGPVDDWGWVPAVRWNKFYENPSTFEACRVRNTRVLLAETLEPYEGPLDVKLDDYSYTIWNGDWIHLGEYIWVDVSQPG